MAKSNRNENEIEKVDPGFLSSYAAEDKSLDMLKQHVVVPRMKILQPLSEGKLKNQFGEGSAIMRPGDALLCTFKGEDHNGFVDIVPLFFFTEYAKWNPLGETPCVVSSSFSPTSEEAKRSVDPKLRYEVFPGDEGRPEKDQRQCRYVSHLRFICAIYGEHPMVGTPVTLSFERGEFGNGKNFISAITMRRQKVGDESIPVPLWAQVWRLKVGFREQEGNKKWYGFDTVAADRPIIKQEEADAMRNLHIEFSDLFEAKCLSVDDEDSGAEAEAAQSASTDY